MLKRKTAVEIIYNDKKDKILSYVEINADTLIKKWCNFHKKFIYIQYDNIDTERRILCDTDIITNF